MSIPATHESILQHTDRFVSKLPPTDAHSDRSDRAGVLVYGVVAYFAGVAALLALIACTLGLLPLAGGPWRVGSPALAVGVNLSLLLLFAGQHSIMARRAFKDRWTRIIHPAMERPTYLLATAVFLLPLLAAWQPVGGSVWSVKDPFIADTITGVAVFGWAYLFLASFAINHVELFGLQQVWANFRGRVPQEVPFRTRWMYRFDRHPIMTGVMLGLWATPEMTGAHLMLAIGLTLYVMVGVHFEERALRRQWGERYEAYRKQTWTLVPLPFSAR